MSRNSRFDHRINRTGELGKRLRLYGTYLSFFLPLLFLDIFSFFFPVPKLINVLSSIRPFSLVKMRPCIISTWSFYFFSYYFPCLIFLQSVHLLWDLYRSKTDVGLVKRLFFINFLTVLVSKTFFFLFPTIQERKS